MSYKIEITEEAEIEIQKAKDWYELKSYGLGDKFSKAVKDTINSLPISKLNINLLLRTFAEF
jgi:hypothetical protein